ncbi:MAG: threonine synthase [Clostridiaceae bacterium]|nr:threonine synthase [Clostridiaceae bacterium]
MRYHSTRNSQKFVQPSEAVLQGLAEDGGLFVPDSLPQLDFRAWLNDSYQEMAQQIFEIFFSDLNANTIKEIIKNSYGNNFDHTDIVPTHWLDSQTGFLELWHGPTLAFKDVALQFLPHLMQAAKKQMQDTKKVLILTATSGDTGKAAMEGFSGVEDFEVIVFYPYQGVSSFQKRQMLTRESKNIRAIAVKGDFDTCQRGVKDLLVNSTFNQKMSELGYQLSSANSINIGRLIPQMIYYIFSYLQAVKAGHINYGENLNIVVPTGNFGNILAACYSKEMGLPLGEIQLAANQNNVLSDFLASGIYDANRELIKTSSPSMDILVASNLERYLYLKNPDSQWINQIMLELKTNGIFSIDKDLLNISATWADENETSQAIAKVYKQYQYLIDPHTAVAYAVAQKMIEEKTTLIASTASPYKFMEKILQSLQMEMPEDDWQAIQTISKIMNSENPNIPDTVKKLWQIEQDQEIVIGKEKMSEAIQNELLFNKK